MLDFFFKLILFRTLKKKKLFEIDQDHSIICTPSECQNTFVKKNSRIFIANIFNTALWVTKRMQTILIMKYIEKLAKLSSKTASVVNF